MEPLRLDECVKSWEVILEGKDSKGRDLGYAPIKTRERKRITARILENTKQAYMTETNQTGGIEIVDPVLISLVRRLAPNLLAYDLVGVQPMSGPTGLIFALRAFYGAQPQGPFSRPGDVRNPTGSSVDSDGLTPSEVDGENRLATNEAFYNEADNTKSGTGSQTALTLTSPTAYDTFATGHGFSTAFGEKLGSGLSGAGEFEEMSFTIQKTGVEAKTRKMKGSYTYELAQDLRAVHGLDAENELSTIISTEMLSEINREIVNTIRFAAEISEGEAQYSNGSLVVDSDGVAVLGLDGLFDLNVNSDGRWQNERHLALHFKISKECNKIAKRTRRGRGNFVVCSSDVAAALDLSGKMRYAPAIDNNLPADDTGNTFVGVLSGRVKVYIDPYLGYDEVIVGYKGTNQMDAGMFYTPYVPLQMIKAISPTTFQPAMAFQTRYGIVANPFTAPIGVRNKNVYYRKFIVKGLM